jgi:hypothetical protein
VSRPLSALSEENIQKAKTIVDALRWSLEHAAGQDDDGNDYTDGQEDDRGEFKDDLMGEN